MPTRRLFRFAYHTAQTTKGRFRPHQLRDADAFAELSPVLYARGFTYGGLLLNLPAENRDKAPQVDISSLSASDLIVLNTRPPIHDLKEEDERPVACSYSNLEDKVFEAFSPYLEICARKRVRLSEKTAHMLPEEYKSRADILFKVNVDAAYKKYRPYGQRVPWQTLKNSDQTAAYLIQVAKLWEGGPGLLAAFGMTGTDTLVWNYFLRTRHEEWVGPYRFLMAEVETHDPPLLPTDLSFADGWTVKPILQIRK